MRIGFTRVVVAVVLTLAVAPLSSQLHTPSIPAGRHEYHVRGFFEGMEMEPWESELSVVDTILGAEAALRAQYKSRRSKVDYLFVYSSTWSRVSPALKAEWVNMGRETNSCSVMLERGELTGKLGDGTVPTAVRVQGVAVPDFAIGAYLASRPLTAGDTARFTMFRCLPRDGRSAIQSQSVTGVVRDGAEARAGAAGPEPVWIVSGDASYPFVAVIAKKDRMLLRSVTLQGSVGYSTDGYARTR
jgi:hypothetical protein